MLHRVDRGIYMLPEAWEDELFNLQWKFTRGVFSHETALYLHYLSDRTPMAYTMTFPFGYNTTNVKEQGVIAKTINKENYLLGLTTIISPNGNKIRIYDIERTLCDIVKTRHRADLQIVNHVMKMYASSKGKEITKLLHYADRLNVKSKILTYMEILL